MTDVIKDALDIPELLGRMRVAEPNRDTAAEVIITFLKHLRDNGPDELMKGKPHLFGGFYWGIIKAFLTYVIKRLEEEQNDK